MSNIQLTRIVRPTVVMTDCSARIENRAATVAVSFTGPDGRMVSLAFDGRNSSSSEGGQMIRETYASYSDCAVQDANGRDCGMVSDLQAMRFLRDALVALDLGDYDDSVTCIDCGEKFSRMDRPNTSVCRVCADSEYCDDCGEYTILDDEGFCNDCAGREQYNNCAACGSQFVADGSLFCADCF